MNVNVNKVRVNSNSNKAYQSLIHVLFTKDDGI